MVLTQEPEIEYIWARMYDKEVAQKRREQSSAMRGEGYYQGKGGRGGAARGRGVPRGGASGSGREKEIKSEGCFRCGEADHWSRECPKKDSVCTWCGATGHIEKTCYRKANGAARGGKTGGRGTRGRGRGGRGGYGRLGEVEEGVEEEVPEHGHAEVLIGEVNMGIGNGDGEEREWVCDSGADFHMSGDRTLFDSLEPIPSTFFVKQIMGKVDVTEWGVVRLCTDGGGGVMKELELRQVLYMPGMKVNIFSLQRIRSKGACSYTFHGVPGSGESIPILNRDGVHIATMKETKRARPTLICSRMTQRTLVIVHHEIVLLASPSYGCRQERTCNVGMNQLQLLPGPGLGILPGMTFLTGSPHLAASTYFILPHSSLLQSPHHLTIHKPLHHTQRCVTKPFVK